jgi:ubiquinone/menaquinone biosynthesis C-methylase UbiE
MTLDPVLLEYSRLANQYDSRWSFYVDATLQATLSRLDIRPGDQVLDLGF